LQADVIKNAADNAKNGTASALPPSGGSSKGRANEMGWRNRAALFMENHPVRAPKGSCGWFRHTREKKGRLYNYVRAEERARKSELSLRSTLIPPLAGLWSHDRVVLIFKNKKLFG
jgi:hypothetical protein